MLLHNLSVAGFAATAYGLRLPAVISLPLTIITLGIFQLVVNSFMLELASYLSVNLLGVGISIASFGSAFMGSILVSIMRSILDGVAND